MTLNELTTFLRERMSLSHIYQPLLIRALVEAGGKATLRQLAQVFLSQDESQLQFYERRIKAMPLEVLKRPGVVEREGDLIALTVPRLKFQQKAEVMLLCETQLQEYVQRRGLAIWDYRLLEVDPVSDNLRFQVLKAAGDRCALCGATTKDGSAKLSVSALADGLEWTMKASEADLRHVVEMFRGSFEACGRTPSSNGSIPRTRSRRGYGGPGRRGSGLAGRGCRRRSSWRSAASWRRGEASTAWRRPSES